MTFETDFKYVNKMFPHRRKIQILDPAIESFCCRLVDIACELPPIAARGRRNRILFFFVASTITYQTGVLKITRMQLFFVAVIFDV